MKIKGASVMKWAALLAVPVSLTVAVANVGQQRRVKIATQQMLKDLSGSNPLIDFSDHHSVDVFLSQGARVDVYDENGITPLLYAVDQSRWNVRVLLDHGADANGQSVDEQTPLMLAARKADAETVRLLLDNGANVNLPGRGADGEKHTPLFVAQFMARSSTGDFSTRLHKVIQLLKAGGARE